MTEYEQQMQAAFDAEAEHRGCCCDTDVNPFCQTHAWAHLGQQLQLPSRHPSRGTPDEVLSAIRKRVEELRKVYATRCDPTAAGVRHALDELTPLLRSSGR